MRSALSCGYQLRKTLNQPFGRACFGLRKCRLQVAKWIKVTEIVRNKCLGNKWPFGDHFETQFKHFFQANYNSGSYKRNGAKSVRMWHVVLRKRTLYISRIIIWERALEMRQELFYFVSEIFQYSVKAHVWMTCLKCELRFGYSTQMGLALPE
jgi:hypothetical protein